MTFNFNSVLRGALLVTSVATPPISCTPSSASCSRLVGEHFRMQSLQQAFAGRHLDEAFGVARAAVRHRRHLRRLQQRLRQGLAVVQRGARLPDQRDDLTRVQRSGEEPLLVLRHLHREVLEGQREARQVRAARDSLV